LIALYFSGEDCSTSTSRRVYAVFGGRTRDQENLDAGITGSSEKAVSAPKATFLEQSGSHL
jgi:hypothetical protein